MEKPYRILGYIENGVVIDHIPHGSVWKIIDVLKVKGIDGRISLGDGYPSKKIGKKGILKIEGIYLSEYYLNLIALIATDATVNIVTNGVISNKIRVKVPSVLNNVIECPNNNCICNDSHERVESIIKFEVELGFTCHYCEREYKEDELKLKSH